MLECYIGKENDCMEPKWKLGDDLSTEDSLFDGITFDACKTANITNGGSI